MAQIFEKVFLPIHVKYIYFGIGMENSSEKWILVDTFFQNEGILVDIFKGWILVETFQEFSWTFIVHENSSLFLWISVDIFGVNSSGHFFQCNNTSGQVRLG